jgi:hypothetical protein
MKVHKLPDSLPINDEDAEMCIDEFNVTYCLDFECKLPNHNHLNKIYMLIEYKLSFKIL